MSKNIKWAAIFLAAMLVSLGVIIFGQFSHGTVSAEIYVDGKLYSVVNDLDRQEMRTFTVQTEYGSNTVCYKAGKIWVSEADCENHTCEKYGKASLAGETIVCAPHRLVIKVVSTSYKKADVTV